MLNLCRLNLSIQFISIQFFIFYKYGVYLNEQIYGVFDFGVSWKNVGAIPVVHIRIRIRNKRPEKWLNEQFYPDADNIRT